MNRILVAVLCLSAAVAFGACGGGDDDGGGAGPGTNYPDAGDDRFENTHATVQIEITQQGAAGFGAPLLTQLETIELDGPALIKRSDPRKDGDLFVVDTEIVEMELRGTGSFGPVIVRESADKESKGDVRQQSAGQDFPAASFFDIYVEIEVSNVSVLAGGLVVNDSGTLAAGTALVLHNEEAMHMTSTLSSLPPAKGEGYRGEDERPLYTPAGLEVGRIVDALHVPEPDEDAATEEPAATSTSAPAATPAATNTPSAGGPTSKGGCTHGTGQSVLHILFSGLRPGQRVSGLVSQSPPDGMISPREFDVMADANGEARVDKDIGKFGTYGWIANDGDLRGNYTVAQMCPGPP